MNFKILDKRKKKSLIKKLSYLGIEKIPYLTIKTGKEKIRAYSGNFSSDELRKLFKILRIEGIGLYIGKEVGDSLRISLDGLHVLKKQIKKNIINIQTEQENLWFLGRGISLKKGEYSGVKGFVAVKSGEDFIGTGKISEDCSEIFSFLPKPRRRKQNQ